MGPPPALPPPQNSPQGDSSADGGLPQVVRDIGWFGSTPDDRASDRSRAIYEEVSRGQGTTMTLRYKMLVHLDECIAKR
eukprot:14539513-Heterocapsa_arctica.AAC.1